MHLANEDFLIDLQVKFNDRFQANMKSNYFFNYLFAPTFMTVIKNYILIVFEAVVAGTVVRGSPLGLPNH